MKTLKKLLFNIFKTICNIFGIFCLMYYIIFFIVLYL